MKNIVITLVVLIVVIVGAAFLVKNNKDVKPDDTNTPPVTTVKGEGKVYFTITDAAVDMKNVSEITMSVSKVEIQSQTKGWVTVSSEPKNFNLLELKSKGQVALVGSETVSADTYNQIRLTVDKVVVKNKTGATSEAKLPSNTLKINSKVVVSDKATSTVKLDVLADKSLHVTGKGKYIFTPVLKVESRSDADITVDSKNYVTIKGGDVDSDITVGTDVDGETKVNFMLDTKASLDIGTDGLIKIQNSTSSGSGLINIKTDTLLEVE